MKTILLDTNVILDIALKREPHFANSAEVLRSIEKHQIKSFLSATSINDIYYIARKDHGHKITIEFITNLIDIVDIAGVDKYIIINAINSEIKDFEDAIQHFAAIDTNCNIIITRNKSDFKNSGLQILTPEEFLIEIEKATD